MPIYYADGAYFEWIGNGPPTNVQCVMEDVDMSTGAIPDTCQSCGATLVDVPFKGNKCPHCGHDVVKNPPHFGAEQWDQISPRHRDRDPEVQMSRTPQPND